MGAQKDTEYNATPFSHGAEIVDGCNTDTDTDTILEIFGKYWKYLGNIGNIWLQPRLLQLRRKAMNWFLLRRERSEPQLKTTIHCRMSCSCRSTERYAADRYGPLEARTG